MRIKVSPKKIRERFLLIYELEDCKKRVDGKEAKNILSKAPTGVLVMITCAVGYFMIWIDRS